MIDSPNITPLGIIGPLLLGNLLAIVVHCGTWWLRRRSVWTLSLLAIAGLLFLLYAASVVKALGWDMAGQDILDGYELNPGQQYQERRSVIVWSVIVLSGVSIVGFIQAWQIPARWWQATLAVFAEIGVALVHGLKSIDLIQSWDIWPGCSIIYLDWSALLCSSFAVSLFLLMVFRPMMLKFVDGFLQTWRDWFRLNYQCHKLKF